MDKLQALITLHKNKLGHHMIIDDVAREYKKVILLDFQIDGTNQTFSLNDLIFSTPFLSWLERKEDGTYMKSGWMGSNDLFIRSDTNTSDYHKINLALLDTDSERITYIVNNTF